MQLPARDEIDHESGRPQHWSVADQDLRQWVDAIFGRLGQLDGVVAVYLHGSLAMGSYFRPKSDVDLLVIVEGGIVESPVYGVLNLCRSLQLVLEDPVLPPSKEESARWALENLSVEHRPIVAAALECYRSHAQVPSDLRRFHGHRWDEEPLLDIAAYAQDLIHSHL